MSDGLRKRGWVRPTVAMAVSAWLLGGAVGCGESEPAATVLTGSSYLECAAREMLGAEASVGRLAEPGMCPGHFELKPSQVTSMREATVVLRFDFQRGLEEVVGSGTGPAVKPVALEGGLSVPGSYVSACGQSGAALVAAGLVDQAVMEQRLLLVRRRMDVAGAWAKEAISQAGLRGEAVVASGHQAGFCRWLGLKVVSEFPALDRATPGDIDRAVSAGRGAGVRVVVGNRAEGVEVAEKIASALGDARLVVLDNFPAMTAEQPDFDTMLRQNVERVTGARTE